MSHWMAAGQGQHAHLERVRVSFSPHKTQKFRQQLLGMIISNHPLYTLKTQKRTRPPLSIKPTTMQCSRSLRMVKFTCLQYKKASVENARVDKGSTKLPTLKEFISLLEEQVVRIKHDNTLVLSQTPSINLV
jgi:hypothetical protein